jgi:hypothetical protein
MGRIYWPKAKGPHHHIQILKLFQLVSVSKKGNHFKNPLDSGFYLVKGKPFETGGGISNLENAS